MNELELLLSAIVIYRVTLLLSVEDGPFAIFAYLRHLAGVRYDEYSDRYGKNEFARLLMCPYCTSLWLALITAVIFTPFPAFFLWWFVVGGAVAILFRLTGY